MNVKIKTSLMVVILLALLTGWYYFSGKPPVDIEIKTGYRLSIPDSVTARVITVVDSTEIDSLRTVISRLQLRLVNLRRKKQKTKIVRRDSIVYIALPDTLGRHKVITYKSEKSYRQPYLDLHVSAFALAPVDSFAVRSRVDYKSWYRDNVAPAQRREKWKQRAQGFVVGVGVTALGILVLNGVRK